MATKKTTKKTAKPKTRTSSKSAPNTNFFKWWMALLLIAVVAVVGIVVLRQSQASRPIPYNGYGAESTISWTYNSGYGFHTREGHNWNQDGNLTSYYGFRVWKNDGTYNGSSRCALVTPIGHDYNITERVGTKGRTGDRSWVRGGTPIKFLFINC